MSLPYGFTLIEILVVVAIIALLMAILIPSLSRAKEQAKQSVCLSNLHQHGLAFTAFAANHKGYLPIAARFKYALAEGEYYLKPGGSRDWVQVNGGALYPRYIGKNPELFYCPSNRDADADGPRGMDVFLQRYKHPKQKDPQYVYSGDAGNSPIGAYGYALPAKAGQHPRNAGKNMYPVEVIKGDSNNPNKWGRFYKYMTDPTELTDEEAAAFLGHFPQHSRGKHNVHALLTDAFFGGYRGYHLNGFNVLYSDFHARRVPDPSRKIVKGNLGSAIYYSKGKLATQGKPFMVWDYFSRNH
ncbi:MAG: type II secretion system protein [Planctomycetota bacterium]